MGEWIDPRRSASGRAPRSFAVGYLKGSGDALVYGALVAAALCFAAALLYRNPSPLLGAPVALYCAYRYYPMVESRRPQLGADSNGLFIDGLGFLNWADIANVELFETSVRSIMLATLRIRLKGPLDDAVARPQRVEAWRSGMTRVWSRRRDAAGDRLEVTLHPLSNNPAELAGRITAFLR